MDQDNQTRSIGSYTGSVAPEYDTTAWLEELATVTTVRAREDRRILSPREDEVCCVDWQVGDDHLPVAIKSFDRQSPVKDRADRVQGSRARRSFEAARALQTANVGTPAPIAYLDRWEDNRLKESHYLSVYDASLTSFRRELIRLYREVPLCEMLMDLLRTVADAVRCLHDAGIMHRDMGNQNILLRRLEGEGWEEVQFIDLNRARMQETSLSMRDRGFDLSRIFLPSDLLRIFKEMYFGGPPPRECETWEQRYRQRFAFHTGTRKLRHPFRSRRRERRVEPADTYPPVKDIWVWDGRSVQAVNVLRRTDRKALYPVSNHIAVAASTARALAPVYTRYKEIRHECFRHPVSLSGRIGVAIAPEPATAERELDRLRELGPVPILARLYHHQDERRWAFTLEILRRLHDEGRSVSLALVQDRKAVLDPGTWKHFVEYVLDRAQDMADWVEVGHAFNRVKWGFWTLKEYGRWLEATGEVCGRFPNVKVAGPAGIDFEYHHVLAALSRVPSNLSFRALSHLLYVDRRGAPENRQEGFALVEKIALARAIARWSPACEDRLLITEVNWPLEDGGIYSPIGSPYLYPGQRLASPPSASERDYARYMIRYLAQCICTGMVERVFWWRLVAQGFGLIDDADPDRWRIRPAFTALQYFLEVLGDSTFVRKVPTPAGTHALAFRQTNGALVILAYSFSGDRSIEVSFSFERATDASGYPSEQAGLTLPLTGEPLYLFDVQLKEESQ